MANSRRLLTLLLTLAFALAGATAAMAQDESPAPAYDPPAVEEWDEDEALIFYGQLQERLLEMGVAEEDLDEALAYLQATYADLSDEDKEALAEAWAARDVMQEMTEEEAGEEVDMGDEEFGQAEEEEPDLELGDDDEEESE